MTQEDLLIDPNSTLRLSVIFEPNEPGEYSSNVKIFFNDKYKNRLMDTVARISGFCVLK